MNPRELANVKSRPVQQRPEPQPPRRALFPIVGVGASAGGLEAFTQLLQALELTQKQLHRLGEMV